jgi:hypothetical protein
MLGFDPQEIVDRVEQKVRELDPHGGSAAKRGRHVVTKGSSR